MEYLFWGITWKWHEARFALVFKPTFNLNNKTMADRLITATLFNGALDASDEPIGLLQTTPGFMDLNKGDNLYLVVLPGNFTADQGSGFTFTFQFTHESIPIKDNSKQSVSTSNSNSNPIIADSSGGTISGDGSFGMPLLAGPIRSVINESTFQYTLTITYTTTTQGTLSYSTDPKIRVNPGGG